MIRQSPSIKFLISALAEFHAETPQVIKDSINPHFSNKFASQGAIDKALAPYLHKVGLVLTQFPCVMEDGSPGLDSLLAHVSGEWLASDSPLVMDKNNAQGQGSGLTYLRRYATCAILRITADEDDDANKASASTGKRAVSRETPPVFVPPTDDALADVLHESVQQRTEAPAGNEASGKQLSYLRSLIRDNGMSDSDVELMVNQHAPTWPGDLSKLNKGQAGKLIELLK